VSRPVKRRIARGSTGEESGKLAPVSTVLLVQPDPELKEAWSGTLTGRGYDVLAVSGVLTGIERAREGGIDVIIVDTYDGANGVAELAAELDRLPDAPPVILVSSSPRAPALSVHIGAAAFVPKPCDPDDLADQVERITSVAVRILLDEDDTAPRPREEI
jgi:DNA-binding NtrC family response regulator